MTFLDFIKDTPTSFHATLKIATILKSKGFVELNESDNWKLEKGGKYFFTRNKSSVLAFTVPEDISDLSFNIAAAHTDSPTFKVKPNYALDKSGYKMLNTEIYGGPILNTWCDRPLNIAGRLIVKNKTSLETKLVSFDRAVAIIPNCSIHYYHELNTGVKLNPQTELVPLFGDRGLDADLYSLLAKKYNIKKEDIVSSDLYLASLDRGCYGGANEEFIFAPQIDNLECSFALMESIIESKPNKKSSNVIALFDNEEIGSSTRQGAGSKMLSDTLERIALSLGLSKDEFLVSLTHSFMVSADNAQGFHPNYAQKYDPTCMAFMNSGIVIKNAARGSYTTDGLSLAYFKTLCDNVGAKYQLNTNRSDVPGGSTLGAISLHQVSIPSVDIGLPQIAMHSILETAGRFDIEYLELGINEFFQRHILKSNDGTIKFE